MIAKDILDIMKDHLEDTIKSSQDSQRELETDLYIYSRDYLNGYYDGVIYLCDELLDLFNLLTK